MSGGIGLERTALAGAVATSIGLVAVALRPPTSLSPVAFLGTLALGAGLGVVALAGFDFVATRLVATDGGPGVGESEDRDSDTPDPDVRGTDSGNSGAGRPEVGGSSAGGPEPVQSASDARNGGLAATEELLRGGSGGHRGRTGETGQDETGTTGTETTETGTTETRTAETGRRFDVDEDDEGFIWGDEDERQDG